MLSGSEVWRLCDVVGMAKSWERTRGEGRGGNGN